MYLNIKGDKQIIMCNNIIENCMNNNMTVICIDRRKGSISKLERPIIHKETIPQTVEEIINQLHLNDESDCSLYIIIEQDRFPLMGSINLPIRSEEMLVTALYNVISTLL